MVVLHLLLKTSQRQFGGLRAPKSHLQPPLARLWIPPHKSDTGSNTKSSGGSSDTKVYGSLLQVLILLLNQIPIQAQLLHAIAHRVLHDKLL